MANDAGKSSEGTHKKQGKTTSSAGSKDKGPAGKQGDHATNPFEAMMQGWQDYATQALKKSSESGGGLMGLFAHAPEQMEQMGKAGTYLKDLREVAGLTIEELADAIDLDDPDVLRSAEAGKSQLSFESLARLGSFYSRNDPLPFILRYSREYNPLMWQMLKTTGLDKLVITVEREVQFVNIYRSRDRARQLSDEQFARVLAFMQQAFDLALDFIEVDEEE